MSERREPEFFLLLDGARPVPATELASILSALNASFRQYGRSRYLRGRSLSLAVSAVEQGCIKIILEALDGAEKVWEAGKLLAPFATHLMEAASILLGLKPGRVTAADKKTLGTVSQTVTNGNATQINLVINGEVHLHVDGETAPGLLKAIKGALPENDSRLVAARPVQVISAEQTFALASGQLEGTAMRVDDDWFARLLGGEGVLVPLKASADIAKGLVHRGLYRFRGALVRGSHGVPVGIEVLGVERIG